MIIPIQNHWSYDRLPRNKDLRLQINHTCNSPSKVLLIDHQGDCFVCGCEAWLPISLGKITDFESLYQVWANPVAKKLQRQIDLKTFDHCAVTRCGVEYNDIHFPEYTVSINIDPSCNLWCPSCRSEKKMLLEGDGYNTKLNYVNHIVSLLEKFDEPTKIIMSGNGDPLASAIMRPLIHRYRPRHRHKLRLFTNGLLLRKQLDNNPVVEHISEYLMSIDAGSKDVYEQIRLGGKWEILLDNFDWLKKNAAKGANISITLVLQQKNHKDLVNFAQVATDYGFNGSITKLENWASWGPGDYEKNNVLDPAHPQYQDAIVQLLEVRRRYPKIITFGAGILSLLD